MFKRAILVVSMSLIVALAMVLSIPMTIAQDADAEPTAIVGSFGEGAIEVSYWNGLTGSDGITMNEMLAAFAEEIRDGSGMVGSSSFGSVLVWIEKADGWIFLG